MAESLERPNLVFITTDQHRGDCTGIDGHPILETPHLDQLANEGVYFPRAYSPCPVCVPARMVMMTGQSPYNTGFFTNSSSALGQTDTLPRILGGLGYQTQLIGKAHFSPQRARLGFDNTIINESGRYREGDDYHLWLNKTPYAGLERATSIGNNDVFSRRSVVPETHHVNTWTANECIEFLDRRDPTCPFFLWMSFSRPHSQYDPPAPYDAWYDPEDVPPPIRTPDEDFLPPELREASLRYDWDRMSPARIARARQHYFGQITHIDHQIGRFLAVAPLDGVVGQYTGDLHLGPRGYDGGSRAFLQIPFFRRFRSRAADSPGAEGMGGGDSRPEIREAGVARRRAAHSDLGGGRPRPRAGGRGVAAAGAGRRRSG